MKLLAQLGLLERWQALTERDRQALVLMLVVITGALFYLMVWQPAHTALTQAKAFYQKERVLNEYLHQRLSQSRHIAPNRLESDALYEVAYAAAQALGANQPTLKLTEQNQLMVMVNSLSAVELFAWLAKLDAQGIVIVQADLNPQGPSLLSGQLVLAGGG